MKLNVQVLSNQGADEYPLYYSEEQQEEIIEINYID
jgi:hypothetical protein